MKIQVNKSDYAEEQDLKKQNYQRGVNRMLQRHIHTFEERAYQSDTVDKVCELFKENTSVLIESPVGSGKTLMGLMVVKRIADEKYLQGDDLTVNYVAARRHILKQAQILNEELFHCNINFVSAFDKTPPKADMMIIDEAHHEATQSILNMYDSVNNTLTLGLSATPLRTDRMKLSFQKVVKSATIPFLIDKGFLSKFHSYKLSIWDPRVIARIYLDDIERFGKSLVFFKTIRECKVFSEILNNNGVHCEVVTGSSDKDRQLEDFLENRIDVLTNVSVLTEGFDVPQLQSVFIRDASRVPTIQMAGRGLRKAEGKNFCNFIQSNNSKYPVEKIAAPSMSFSYFKNSWRSLSDDTEIILRTVEAYRQMVAELEKRRITYRTTNNCSHKHEIAFNGNPSIY